MNLRRLTITLFLALAVLPAPADAATPRGPSRGVAAYTFGGKVHVLRLSDGADSIVGYASEARFMDSGLVYADGSRVHLAPFGALPLR